ncbi:pyruvate dehydrogenase complex dihydrolipoamide acetyltransferase [Rhizorhabdus phycosphaerae]|uniref:pyruvate dehydrogenase complex dihydrolipoamide acetyltransferase n=1 Tax=Rhizorhabdus phycosphaerae TaxID=2711156 RepID=UPI0013EA7E35|nr:pyruvate dehydrogenase complex dihydrolipoamide acetyltransferase [Rhizorhabdus phycosphaerae]
MAIELKMPALSPTMEKGNLARWLVAEGDLVKPGDLIAEIETDKATMEFEAVDQGRIASLVVPAGTDDVAVGTVIALLADTDAVIATPALEEAAPAIAGPTEAAPPPPPALPAEPAAGKPSDEPAAPRPRPSPADRIKVSPLALRIAKAKGMVLDGIVGTGPHGRIVRADLGIAPLVKSQPAVSQEMFMPPLPPATIAPPAGVPVESIKLSAMRKTIARRLTESKQMVPHFYLTARCNIDPLLKLRGELNATLEARGVKLSVNDMLIKALALALVAVPEANVQFGGEELHRFSRVDISMAVAIDGGLVTPVIKDAGALSLSAIAQASKILATKARDGKLAPEDYQGGTASISNLGMFGIDEMFPVINPPQALILGIGAGVKQPWKVDGGMALATIMAATASFDHRAIDGAVAAQFMQALRELIETPLLILG